MEKAGEEGAGANQHERFERSPQHCREQIVWDDSHHEDEENCRQREGAGVQKGPYKVKAELIRAKQLPKALYGCETTPVNERALRKLQTTIVDTLTYNTSRRSVDLTFAAASHGNEVDPDVAIFKNRVLGLRRAKAMGGENERIIESIMEQYGKQKEPGIMEYSKETYEALKYKEDAGEPMSRSRSKIRKQCKPKGAVGYLLESVHLNCASMDRGFNMWQYNQAPICVAKAA